MICLNCKKPIEEEDGDYVHATSRKFACYPKGRSGKLRNDCTITAEGETPPESTGGTR